MAVITKVNSNLLLLFSRRRSQIFFITSSVSSTSMGALLVLGTWQLWWAFLRLVFYDWHVLSFSISQRRFECYLNSFQKRCCIFQMGFNYVSMSYIANILLTSNLTWKEKYLIRYHLKTFSLSPLSSLSDSK